MLQTTDLIPAIADESRQQSAVSYDEPLLARLRDRDPQAFDLLVTDHAVRIQRLVSRLLGWESDCDDVVQDVFVVAWEKIDRFRSDASITTWLFSIAINQCRKQRRTRGSWRKVFQRLCVRAEGEVVAQPDDDTVPGVEMIFAAINQLPHRDRELIVLCSLEERSLDEAGTLLGVRKNTLEVRLHRARKKLKQILQSNVDSQNR